MTAIRKRLTRAISNRIALDDPNVHPFMFPYGTDSCSQFRSKTDGKQTKTCTSRFSLLFLLVVIMASRKSFGKPKGQLLARLLESYMIKSQIAGDIIWKTYLKQGYEFKHTLYSGYFLKASFALAAISWAA